MLDREKNTVTEKKNIPDGFISTLDMAEESISELQCMTIELLKTKDQREQKV